MSHDLQIKRKDFEEIMMNQTVEQNLASVASHSSTATILLGRIRNVQVSNWAAKQQLETTDEDKNY